MSCLFCNEQESAGHLFFWCCVAKVFSEHVFDLCGRTLGTNFESVAKLWLYEKNVSDVNVCTTAALWSLWKLRNEMCRMVKCAGAAAEDGKNASEIGGC
jgi:hypothetical protein